MFVLGEIHVRSPKLVNNHVWVETFWEKIPKDHSRVLKEGPKFVSKTVQDSPNHGGNRRPVGHSTPRWYGLIVWDLVLVEKKNVSVDGPINGRT